MRLHALLSFYDESPALLASCAAGLPRAGVDALVAVDGAYGSFPGGQGASSHWQHAALTSTCGSVGLGLTLHVPTEPWAGDEVAKRSAMHALAWGLAAPEDWLLVIDADEVVDDAPGNLLDQLHSAPHLVAEVTCRESGGGDEQRRRLFSNARPLHLERNHYTYVDSIGKVLAGAPGQSQVPALGTDLRLSHRPHRRSPERDQQRRMYYDGMREQHELGPACERCGAPATLRTRTGWRRGSGGLLSDPLEVCAGCAELVAAEERPRLRAMGVEPGRVGA